MTSKTPALPKVSIVIPCLSTEDPQLKRCVASIRRQSFKDWELIVSTRGNSEEAKAYGILQAKGEILCMLCADNEFVGDDDLAVLVKIFEAHTVYRFCGLYTSHYAFLRNDSLLNRYFSAIGGNDPLSFFLRRNDRRPYWERDPKALWDVVDYEREIPSIGDNGFLIDRKTMLSGMTKPEEHYCVDAIEDLRRKGCYVFLRVSCVSIWHRSGDSVWEYFKRRWKYTRDLYWRDLKKRRWNIIRPQDRIPCALWALGSILIVPPVLWVLWKGLSLRRTPPGLKSSLWIHPVVCLGLTLIYGVLCLRQLIQRH